MRANAFFLSLCLLSIPIASHAAETAIYGLNENVEIPEFGLEIAAKLDTGAQTASLSARDIERFKKDGKTWTP